MKSLLTLAFVLTFGAVSALQVQAQSRISTHRTETLRTLTSIQMVESLQSPLSMVRNQTLKNAIIFSTLYPERIDIDAAVTSIARVAADDDSDTNRRLAIAALQTIDSYRANQYLAALENMREDEYRTVIAGVLSEYREVQEMQSM